MRLLPALVFLILIFFSCSGPQKEGEMVSENQTEDSTVILKQFLLGLWSLDSGNMLTNEGYLFSADGKISFVASELSGRWELNGSDSLSISIDDFHDSITPYHIDSVSQSRMILSSGDERFVFRKVPFGMNEVETVLTGFVGTIRKGEQRQYEVSLPAIKKIGIKLNVENPDVRFSLLDGDNELASKVVHWQGIVVRGGKYKLVVSSDSGTDASEFDLKVYTY